MLDLRSAWALLPATVVSLSAGGVHAEPITLQEALARAGRANPDLQAASAEVAVAEGERAAAGQIAYNPEVAVAGGPRLAAGSTLFDLEAGVSQTFELGGKRGRRAAAATARLGAARARLQAAQRVAEVRARHAFALALVERQRLERAREAEAVSAELLVAANDRLRLGAGTQLEVNVAIADQGRARHDRIDAERRLESARAELAAAVGGGAGESFEPAGEIERLPVLSASEERFVARALEQRADLAAQQADLRAAAADVGAANALAIPDLTVSLTYAREQDDSGSTREVVVAGVAMPIPIFNRNQGSRAAARARHRRAGIVADAGRNQAERQARTAFRNFGRAREALLGFDESVVSRLGENLALARQSFVAGKIGYLEFNVLRRDLVATGFAYLDALAEGVDAWRDAALAAGGVLEVSP
jgi:cobalt-zinc-cadmium efflux system outer membrane protein